MINKATASAICGILLWLAVIVLIMAIFIPLMTRPAHPQHNHDHHKFHAYYQNWINNDGAGCCNDRDCRTIAEFDIKETKSGTFVRIEGEFCAVLTKHYLARGNAPDWGSAHVCVQPKGETNLSPCQRLLCFQPKPLS